MEELPKDLDVLSDLYTDRPIKAKDILLVEEDGKIESKFALKYNIIKPRNPETGEEWDQTSDAERHMRYAATLGLPRVSYHRDVIEGTAIIAGGAPAIKNHLDDIRRLASDPKNKLFALNWTHTWLLQNGIVPHGCVFFEIDVEPDNILKHAHKDVIYYICSHCHNKTFDSLKDYNRVLWHSIPNSEGEKVASKELYDNELWIGGGITTFTRSISLAMALGFRDFDLFGVDSSLPDDSETTHIEGYPTPVTVENDAFYVWAKTEKTNIVRRFKTVGYLAHQVEEFKQYCMLNHCLFSMRVHGDGLLPFVHREQYPGQYPAHA